jgi:sugar phosphate isomerase/epimerase
MEKVEGSAQVKASRVGESAEQGQAVSRRAFLKSAMLGAAAAGSGLVASAWSGAYGAPAPKKKIVVGAHLWVYAANQPGYDPTPVLEQVFADMSYAGLDCVELMHQVLMHDDAVERLGELSQKYKLPVIGTSFEGAMWNREAHPAILKEAELFLPRLAKLGGRTLGTSVGHAPQTKTPAQLDAQAEMVRKLRALAQSHGIVLNLHNHTYEVENNEHDLKGTLARIPDAKLGPDLNWLLRGGVDPVDFIKRYGKRIIFLHLRDQKADGTWSEAMGEGHMDYVAIGRALHEINFRGDAMIELAHEQGFHLTRPLRESLKMSREFVRKTLGF